MDGSQAGNHMMIKPTLPCFAHKIFDLKNNKLKYELLSRPRMTKGQSIEAYFSKMGSQDLLEVVEQQMNVAARFQKDGIGICSINVDNKILTDDANRKSLLGLARQYRIPVIMEFTEVHPMPPVGVVNALFNELRAYGVMFALDDFGTGFNGMSLFVDYDFDIIKVDRSLIADVTERKRKADVLRLLVRMLKTLGKTHVVEGVETALQLTVLQQLGFNCFQGYHFHRPQPVEEILSGQTTVVNFSERRYQ